MTGEKLDSKIKKFLFVLVLTGLTYNSTTKWFFTNIFFFIGMIFFAAKVQQQQLVVLLSLYIPNENECVVY